MHRGDVNHLKCKHCTINSNANRIQLNFPVQKINKKAKDFMVILFVWLIALALVYITVTKLKVFLRH